MNPLPESEAAAIWQVLVDHAGADPTSRVEFIAGQTNRVVADYPFLGWLGDGGAFHRARFIPDLKWVEDWHVESDDKRPGRRSIIDKTNQALAELRKEHAQ